MILWNDIIIKGFKFPTIKDEKDIKCQIKFFTKINDVGKDLVKLDETGLSLNNDGISDLLLNHLQKLLGQLIGESWMEFNVDLNELF